MISNIILILFVLVTFYVLRYKIDSSKLELKPWDLSLAFGIKLLGAGTFYYIYTHYYGIGYLYFDSYMYIIDSKELYLTFFKNKTAFFQLLTGIGENTDLIEEYLKNTNIWSQPNATVIDDAKNVIKVNALIYFISQGNMFIHFFFFTLLSLFGLTQLYLFFKNYILLNKRFFFLIILISPSLLFWGSGVLKEALVLFSFGILIYFIRKSELKKLYRIGGILMGVFLAIQFKTYIFLAFLFPLLLFLVFTFKNLRIYLLIIIQLAFLCVFWFFMPIQKNEFVYKISNKQFDFNNITRGGVYFKSFNKPITYNINLENKKNIIIKNDTVFLIKNCLANDMINHGKVSEHLTLLDRKKDSIFRYSSSWTRSNSYIKPRLILYNEITLLKNIPSAIMNSLFRPQFNDPSPKFKYLLIIETYLLFGFFILSLIFKRKLSKKEVVMVLFLLQSTIILALFIGWTTPVLGAIVRYRIFCYLMILLASCILIDPKLWKKEKNMS